MNRKLVYFTSRNLQLVGDLQHVSDNILVILCHGFTSNRYSRGRFPAIMQALAARGISSVAFDFAGCGESDDDVLTLEGQVTDLLEVLMWAREHGYQGLGLYGHSLGGLIVLLAAARGQVQVVAASGAATGPMNYDWQALYGAEAMKRLECEGVLALLSERLGGVVLVGRSLLDAFAKIDQVALLNAIHCPVLLVHGGDSRDSEEQELLAHSRVGLPLLPHGSRLYVVDGAGHSFEGHIDELVDVVVEWLVGHLATDLDGLY